MDTRSDVSDYSDNESSDIDSDVPTTSSHKHFRSSTGTLPPTISTPVFPHIYQDNFYNIVRLAQTLLDRNVRDYSMRRANGHSTRPRSGRQACDKREVGILEEW